MAIKDQTGVNENAGAKKPDNEDAAQQPARLHPDDLKAITEAAVAASVAAAKANGAPPVDANAIAEQVINSIGKTVEEKINASRPKPGPELAKALAAAREPITRVNVNDGGELVHMVFPRRVVLTLDDHHRIEFPAGTQPVPVSLKDHAWLRLNGVKLLDAINRDASGKRTDGPTFEEFTKAGYRPENYPPQGFAEVPSTGLTDYKKSLEA